ncbi:uncharacterized protein LOC123893185 [Trifolium pratense]|uniref:uncharacterized protein LOC123893185 n=1 Tax=Trifolium pratense TaxID=57577 RepID=UPI001E690EB3|nr:uncharacterized protein LOC123893185 [Trifolium pratense]
MDKEGGTISRPPLLIGPENYDYWKAKMMAFLKSIDSRTWKAIENGWEAPVVLDKDGNKTTEVKAVKDYSKDEDELALGNSKALNAIFNGVDINMFRLVKRCTVAKNAWEILRKAHEGTSKVKLSKLQMLRTNFENLCMKEEETIHDFHMNILEFANSFDALGEPISDEKLVSKILRSLPKRFDMKVTAIEESQDLATIQVDELIGSLQTYELGMNQRKEKKNKSLAFASNTGEDEESDLESDESLSEAMVLLGRQFNRVMKRMDKKSKFNVPSIKLDINKQTNDQRRARSDEKISQSEGVQCHECEGYGHIKAECPTFLKRQRKSLTITWSDEDDSEEETESGSAKHVNALTGVCESDAESCDGTSYEELLTTYKDLFIRSNEVYKALEKQKKANYQLQAEKNECLVTIDTLNKEIEKLNGDLEHARKQVRVYGSGEEKFQAMLLKQSAGKKPIGFDYEIVDQQMGYNKATISTPIEKTFPVSAGFLPPHPPTHQGTDTWLKPKPKPPAQTGSMPQHPPPHRNNWSRPKSRRRNWRCHYCGRKGHIRPYCYKLYGYPKNFRSPAPKPENVKTKKEWKEKENDGEIKGIGNLINNGLPNLDNVLLVKGLTTNLISISQLCDQGMKVNFTKSECLVTNEEGRLLMKGVMSKDNCYLWVSEEENHLSTCLLSKEDKVKPWHQEIGHLHLRGLKKVIAEEAIRGNPKLKIEEGTICGECQIGKQTMVAHPRLQHPVTSRALELLHIDLMGPMQTESLCGKREKEVVIVRIRSDHGKEFENAKFFDLCASEGIFLGYSTNNRAYRVYNSRTKVTMESINVVVDDAPSTKTADVESSIQQSYDIVFDEVSGSNNESTNPKSEPARVNKVPFIRDLVEENIVKLEHVATEEQVADIFTKALDATQFERLRGKLGICLHEEL